MLEESISGHRVVPSAARPCVAAPGFECILNVRPGRGERTWKISDHPDQAWVRNTWETQSVDPRLLSQTVQEA